MIWTRPGLHRKTRSLLNLAMLSALNRSHELRLHIRAAVLNNGVTRDEVKEVFLHVGTYCGIPAASQSFKVGAEVFKELNFTAESAHAPADEISTESSDSSAAPASVASAASFHGRPEFSSELFQRGLEVRREVLGAAHVDPSLQKADDFSAAFQQLTTERGMTWTRPGLDRKTRSLLNLVILSALNRSPELRGHIRAAVLSNCPK